MKATASLRNARSSAQKARLVANLIRGTSVEKATQELQYVCKKAAKIIKKVLESAIANAENNEGADIDNLKISKITVDKGPSFKRMMPRAKGRANQIVKHYCHIMIELSDETELAGTSKK